MPSKELIERVARAMLDAERESMGLPHRVFHTPADRETAEPMAQAAISTILAALQEPTEAMLAASGDGHLGRWKDILAASALGEQSE